MSILHVVFAHLLLDILRESLSLELCLNASNVKRRGSWISAKRECVYFVYTESTRKGDYYELDLLHV